MSRPLDFAVLGVPRSGTSGMTRVLNAYTTVICGFERFRPSHDHSRIRFPESFFDESLEAGENVTRAVNSLIKHKPNVVLAGNKAPHYFMDLPNVLRGVPSGKLVVCTRDSASVARSWSRRGGSGGGGWVKGRMGVFSAFELPICLKALLAQPQADIIVSPYNAFRADNFGVAERVLQFLAPGARFEVDDDLKRVADNAGRNEMASIKPPLHDAESEALKLIQAERIDAVLDRGGPESFDAMRPSIRSYLAELPADLIDHAARLSALYRSDAVDRFAKGWMLRAKGVWERLGEECMELPGM